MTTYLALGYLPTDHCIFAAHHKVPPAHYLAGSFDTPEAAKVERYWTLTINGAHGSATARTRNITSARRRQHR
ncbi:MAG: hypothetical protein R2932_50615 [Caldilineaceae bacterium]